MPDVAVLVGSLRSGSVNRQLADNVARIAGDRLTLRQVPLGDLPMYDHDLWDDTPEAVTAFKEQVGGADAILLVTPEYNRYFPPVIKNAIDWGSKPMGANVWTGKPAAAIGATPGQLGAMSAVLSATQLLTIVGCAVMAQPSVFFNHREDMHDSDGVLTDESAREFLSGWVDSFAAWIERMS